MPQLVDKRALPSDNTPVRPPVKLERVVAFSDGYILQMRGAKAVNLSWRATLDPRPVKRVSQRPIGATGLVAPISEVIRQAMSFLRKAIPSVANISELGAGARQMAAARAISLTVVLKDSITIAPS